MRVLVAISRWTNPNSNKQRHAPDYIEPSKPLCGWRKGVHSYSYEESGIVTCKCCLKIMAQEKGK